MSKLSKLFQIFKEEKFEHSNPYHQKIDLEKRLSKLQQPTTILLTLGLSTYLGFAIGRGMDILISDYLPKDYYSLHELSKQIPPYFMGIICGFLGGNIHLGRKIYKTNKKLKNIEDNLS